MDRRLRSVEFVRFALLVTLTIALIDVAGRIGDHPAARHRATGPVSSPTPSATAPTTAGTPGTSGTRPRAGGHPSAAPGTSGAASTSGGTATSSAGSSAGTPTGGTPGTEPVAATLPRSGAAAADLAGVSMFLLAAGAFTVAVSRPRA